MAIVRFILVTVAFIWSTSADAVERSRYRTEYACEGNTLHLDCEPGYVIHLIRANYGRFSITVCNNHGQTDWSVNCMSPRSLRVLHSRCSNRPRCSILANSTIFGDPCEGTFKYLVAHYQCLPAALTIKRPSPPPPSPPAVADGSVPGLTTVAAPASNDVPTSNSTIFEGVQQRLPDDDGDALGANVTSSVDGFPAPQSPGQLSSQDSHAPGSTPNDKDSKADAKLLTTTTRRPTTTSAIPPSPAVMFPPPPPPSSSSSSSLASPQPPQQSYPPPPPQQRQPTSSSRQVVVNGDGGYEERHHGSDGDVVVDLSNSETACPPRVARGLLWNWTAAGYIREQSCPGGASGLAVWRCDGPGWASEYPDLSQCRSLWLNSLRNKLRSQESAMTVASDLAQVTGSKALHGGDIWLSADLISGLARTIRDASDPARAREVMSAVVRSGSHLLGRGQGACWTDLPVEQRGPAATQLLISFEDSAFAMAQVMPIDEAEVFAEENLLAVVQVVDARKNEPVTFPTDRERSVWGRGAGEVSIELHPDDVVKNSHRGRTQIAFFAYENLEDILGQIDASSSLPAPTDGGEEEQEDDGDGERSKETTNSSSSSSAARGTSFVNSRVVSACLGSGRHVQLSRPATVTFRHRVVRNVTNPRCVFWDYTTSSWSSAGCRTSPAPASNATHTACECDHLTNFAVLMDLDPAAYGGGVGGGGGAASSDYRRTSLRVVSYVGCAAAAAFLLAAVVVLVHYSSTSSSSSSAASAVVKGGGRVAAAATTGDDRAVIHKHLCVTLLLAEIIYAAGLDRTSDAAFCGFVAGLLHYFFLAVFAWTLIEGFQLYMMLVEVFEPETSRLRWYYAVGYGVPAAVVATSAIVDPYSYGTRDYCWLSTENYFVFSFVGPVVVILLANLVFLALAFVVMCRHRSGALTVKEESRLARVASWLRGSAALLCLMGLTWSLGLVLRVHRDFGSSFVVACSFCVLNSFLGIFVLFFTCVQNEKVLNHYRRTSEHGCLSRFLDRTSDKKSSFYVSADNCGGQNSTHSTNASTITSPGATREDCLLNINTMPLGSGGHAVQQQQQQQPQHQQFQYQQSQPGTLHHNCAVSSTPYSAPNGTCAHHADLWNAAQTLLHHHSIGAGTGRRLASNGPMSLQQQQQHQQHHQQQQQQAGLMPIVHGRSVSSPGPAFLRGTTAVVHPGGAATLRQQQHHHQQQQQQQQQQHRHQVGANATCGRATCRSIHQPNYNHTYSEIDPVYSEIENGVRMGAGGGQGGPAPDAGGGGNEYLEGRMCPLTRIPLCHAAAAAVDECYYPSAASAAASRHQQLVAAHHYHQHQHLHSQGRFCPCEAGKPLIGGGVDDYGAADVVVGGRSVYDSSSSSSASSASSSSSSAAASPPSTTTATSALCGGGGNNNKMAAPQFHQHHQHPHHQHHLQTDDLKSLASSDRKLLPIHLTPR